MEMTDGLPRARVERAAAIVAAREMERSITFYQRLGFVVERFEGGEYAFASRDGVALHLRDGAEEVEEGKSTAGLYLYVTDADEVYEEWVTAGVTPLGEPEDKEWRMREFAVSDPDGTLLRVGHRLPR